MKKILWLSRHPLGEDQIAGLKKVLDAEVSVETRNVLWHASEDRHVDYEENSKIWKDLVAASEGNDIVICGVFPPVAIEALNVTSEPLDYIPLEAQKSITLLSPVSKQEKSLREDGETQIKFIHLRWAKVVCREWFRN